MQLAVLRSGGLTVRSDDLRRLTGHRRVQPRQQFDHPNIVWAPMGRVNLRRDLDISVADAQHRVKRDVEGHSVRGGGTIMLQAIKFMGRITED